MNTHSYRFRRRQAGFTLVEALVALLVMSFGMLALAGMQLAMNRGADLARQRSEAVRLAQLKMEQLRSYDGINSGSYTYGANVVSSAADETICPTCSAPLDSTTNATFTRNWAVTRSDGITAAAADDLEKWIRVAVSWTDRANQTQSVTLSSVIARNDPVALEGMVSGQARARSRSPKNRSANVPYPAVTLSGGQTSAFIPPPGNKIYVFDNDTGNIIKSCTASPVALQTLSRSGGTVTVAAAGHSFTPGARIMIEGTSAGTGSPYFYGLFTIGAAVAGVGFSYPVPTGGSGATATGGTATRELTLTEGMDLSSLSGVTCTDTTAFLLSGYVRFKTSGAAPTASTIENTNDATLPLNASGPLTIDASATGNGPSAQVCYAQRQKVVKAANLQPSPISSASRSGGIVTLTTSGNHGFAVGQRVAVEQTADFTFIGGFVITSVPSSTSFTYAQPGSNASTSGGTTTRIQEITIPEAETAPPGYTQVLSSFVAYSCILTPVNDGTATAWWGELKLVTDGSWTLGSGGTEYRVCRFSSDYYADNVVANHEHPRYYRRVKGALDNQNFLVIKGTDTCPTDVASNPVAGDFVNTNTVQHQPPLTGTGSHSFMCTDATCSGSSKVLVEPASPTAPVQMTCPATTDGCS